MKTRLALFNLMAIVFLQWGCGPEEDPPQEEVKICTISVVVNKSAPGEDGLYPDTIAVPYICGQAVAKGKDAFDYLISKGYQIIDSCSCADSLYLMANMGVDPIGIIDNPPPGTKDSSMSLNYLPPLGQEFGRPKEDLKPDIYNPSPEKALSTVRIAIVDTGVDTGSVMLDPYFWKNPGPANSCPGYLFSPHGLDLSKSNSPHPMDQQGHGTHVSGIAAGLSPMLPFFLPDVRIELISAKVSENKRNSMDLFTATCGIHYALDQGADVINLSWGYLDSAVVNDKGERVNRAPWIMLDALEEARRKGVVIVAALGNDGLKLSPTLKFWPASFAETWENVIAVGSSSDVKGSTLAGFSNHYGGDLLAPGEEVPSLVPPVIRIFDPVNSPPLLEHPMPDGWALATGTSMSAPFVARTVALMKGKRPAGNVGEYKDFIMRALPGFDPNTLIANW